MENLRSRINGHPQSDLHKARAGPRPIQDSLAFPHCAREAESRGSTILFRNTSVQHASAIWQRTWLCVRLRRTCEFCAQNFCEFAILRGEHAIFCEFANFCTENMRTFARNATGRATGRHGERDSACSSQFRKCRYGEHANLSCLRFWLLTAPSPFLLYIVS